MKFSIDKITLLAIAIPMVALLLVGYISYENTIQFIQRDSLADRLDLINQRLEHLFTTITGAESGQRGFIITNRLDYLEPYNSAVRDIDKQLANLNMLLISQPLNQQISLNEINVLKGLVEAKMAFLNQTITLRQSHGLNAALPMILSNKGKILMDKIRTITDNIQSRLRYALSNATIKTQDYARAMTRIIVITTFAAAAITGISVFAIGRGIYRRHLAVRRSLEIEVQKRTEELQTANNQLLIANEQLKLHDRMQQEFINVAAHELRTPAQSLLGYAELAMIDPPIQIKSYIDAIYRNAFRIQKLTQDILDVTRIESHTLKLNKIKFDLKEIILHVIEDTRLKLVSEGRNKVKLEFKNEMKAGEVIGQNDDIFVRADKDRIMQVISNLLDNAVKFTSEGVVSIDLAREKEYKERKGEEEMAVVSIQDTGSGIDPEIFPRLFTKFSSKSFSGTGLGLYISKNIIEAHDGKIWAENNNEGKRGATFNFSLPLNEEKGITTLH